jgi:radical SAM protein with 4Fe4S-binding SPASM domain
MIDYQTYRWKWENYPLNHTTEKVPIHLDLELTTRCNYRCRMCPHSFNSIESIDMPLEMVKRIIDEFTDKGGCSIKFVYLGEALLYPYLGEVIRYAKDKGIIETMIATNGSLLTKNKAIELIKNGLDWIIFSVDSCKADIYEKIRINGNFNIVVKNIRSFYEIRRKLKSKTPKIWIQCIKQDLNQYELMSGEYIDFWRDYCDEIRISKLRKYNIIESIGETPDFFCDGVYRRMTIRANGDIAMCCGERLDSKLIGNINDCTIEEAWLSNKFIAIRKLMVDKKSHLITACKTCPGRLL